jgi:hypothetical protein
MKKEYQNVHEALTQAIELADRPLVSVAARDSARQAFDAMQGQFDSVQVIALDLARQLPTPRVESKRKALRPTFNKVHQAIEAYALFMQRAIQSDRFEPIRKRILDDAGFCLATLRCCCSCCCDGHFPSSIDDLELPEYLE